MIGVARFATYFSLLLAAVLTAFLLSGSTLPQPAISNLHVAKLELNFTKVATTSTPVFAATSSFPKESTQGATKSTKTAASATSTADLASKLSTTSVPVHKATFNPPSAATTKEAVRRDEDAGRQNYIFQKYRPQIDYESEQPAKTWNVLQSRAITREGDHTNARTTVVIGYFGICAKNSTTSYSCVKSRKGADILEGAPPELLQLAVSIQGAISPLPPIIAITFQGSLILLACFTSFKPRTDLNTKLGQALTLLAFSAFSLSFFTAVLLQSVSAVVYGALSTSSIIMASKGSGGIALAWAAVLFTGLGMCGVVFLLLMGGFKQQTKGHTGELGLARFFGNGNRDQGVTPPLPVHSEHGNASCMPGRGRRDIPMDRGNYL